MFCTITCSIFGRPASSFSLRSREQKPKQSMRKPHLCCSSQSLCSRWYQENTFSITDKRVTELLARANLVQLAPIPHSPPMFRAFPSQHNSHGNIISPSNLSSWIQKTYSEQSESTKGYIWLPYLHFCCTLEKVVYQNSCSSFSLCLEDKHFWLVVSFLFVFPYKIFYFPIKGIPEKQCINNSLWDSLLQSCYLIMGKCSIIKSW